MNKAQCPFKFAKDNNILIIAEPLGSIYGYYNKCLNQKFIHINSELPFWIQNFTTAYQLYYALQDEEYIFLTKKLNYKNDGLKFATDLLCYKMEFSEFKQLALRDGLAHNLHHYYKCMNELIYA